MLVRERMSRPVLTILPDASMNDALSIMHREHVRRLPVVDKRGVLVGIVTEADLNKASPSQATTLSVWEIRDLISKVRVDRIMTRDVVTVTEDTPIEEAARIMADSKISGLPVMRGTELVGLITETDLFKMFLELFGARNKGVRLTVEVPQSPGQLAKLTRAIFDLGGDIIALGTIGREKTSDSGQIMVKVAGVDKETLLEVVTPCVLRVLDVRENQ